MTQPTARERVDALERPMEPEQVSEGAGPYKLVETPNALDGWLIVGGPMPFRGWGQPAPPTYWMARLNAAYAAGRASRDADVVAAHNAGHTRGAEDARDMADVEYGEKPASRDAMIERLRQAVRWWADPAAVAKRIPRPTLQPGDMGEGKI